jgi:hypothetical protein
MACVIYQRDPLQHYIGERCHDILTTSILLDRRGALWSSITILTSYHLNVLEAVTAWKVFTRVEEQTLGHNGRSENWSPVLKILIFNLLPIYSSCQKGDKPTPDVDRRRPNPCAATASFGVDFRAVFSTFLSFATA